MWSPLMVWLVNLLIPVVLALLILVPVMAVVIGTSSGATSAFRAAWSLRRRPLSTVSREDAHLGIQRAASSARTLCAIAYWADIVALALFALAVVVLVIPNLAFDDGRLAMKSQESANVLHALMLTSGGESIVPSLIESAMAVGLFRVLRRFFAAIVESGRPFESERAEDLRQVGAWLLQMGVVPLVVGNLLAWLLSGLVGVEFGAGAIGAVQIPAILLGVIVCAFAEIWRYGCALQEQDDGLV